MQPVLDVFKIMIGQPHGDDIFNFVEQRYGVNLALNGIGFNNGDNLAIGEYSVYLNAFKGGNPVCYGSGTAIKAADYNS